MLLAAHVAASFPGASAWPHIQSYIKAGNILALTYPLPPGSSVFSLLSITTVALR